MLTLGSPFDSIIIASEGDRLLEILSHLAFYDINSENSNIYGTSLWEDTNKKDNLFKGTYYTSSLKYKKDEFIQNFKNVFSKPVFFRNLFFQNRFFPKNVFPNGQASVEKR